jgi:hypothetical protein
MKQPMGAIVGYGSCNTKKILKVTDEEQNKKLKTKKMT